MSLRSSRYPVQVFSYFHSNILSISSNKCKCNKSPRRPGYLQYNDSVKHKIKERAKFPIRHYAIDFSWSSQLVTMLHLIEPGSQPRRVLKKIAKKYMQIWKLDELCDLQWQRVISSLIGKTSKKRKEVTLISKDSNKIHVYRLQDGFEPDFA